MSAGSAGRRSPPRRTRPLPRSGRGTSGGGTVPGDPQRVPVRRRGAVRSQAVAARLQSNRTGRPTSNRPGVDFDASCLGAPVLGKMGCRAMPISICVGRPFLWPICQPGSRAGGYQAIASTPRCSGRSRSGRRPSSAMPRRRDHRFERCPLCIPQIARRSRGDQIGRCSSVPIAVRHHLKSVVGEACDSARPQTFGSALQRAWTGTGAGAGFPASAASSSSIVRPRVSMPMNRKAMTASANHAAK